jgi:hypothetical protein
MQQQKGNERQFSLDEHFFAPKTTPINLAVANDASQSGGCREAALNASRFLAAECHVNT